MPDIYDPDFVKGVFDRCSRRYIWFSNVCSFGFTERWRRQCVQNLPLNRQEEISGYDLMAGTGEAWPHLLKRFPNLGAIIAVDISSGMHELAIERLHKHRQHKISFVEDNILNSELPDNSADFIISTFGLKTFNSTQHDQLADVIARTLKPGGAFSMIEASDPRGWWMRPFYKLYLSQVLPLVERLFMRGAQDFMMINEYTANFQNSENVGKALLERGLTVHYRKHFFGTATSVSGTKPPVATNNS